MRRFHYQIAASLLFMLLAACSTNPSTPGQSAEHENPLQRFAGAVADDYRTAYSTAGLLDLAPHVAAHGVLANTNADRWIRDHWQEDVRGEPGDDFFYKFLRVGDFAQNRWSVPIYSLTMAASGYSGTEEDDSPVATWASRSLRANILGGPQGWALTYMLGTHRPDTGHSGWAPWNDNDGVSGHALYGAVPFLTAARMAENPWWRYGLYAASTLPPLARVNLNKHYASQAYLGWAVAFVATDVVANADSGDPGSVSWLILPVPGGVIASVGMRF